MRRQPRRTSTIQQPAPALRIGRQPIEAIRVQNKESFKAPETILPIPPGRPISSQSWTKDDSIQPLDSLAQAVVNEFFYWLRASRLETDRVVYWWANRMLQSNTPLAERMALFWHGHFATNEDKVRDYRKMLKQLETFQAHGLGNFRTLLIAVAQDPAMLAFLDAGVNVKGAPNENFAREIMELFTMGVGNYSEQDVTEAARAINDLEPGSTVKTATPDLARVLGRYTGKTQGAPDPLLRRTINANLRVGGAEQIARVAKFAANPAAPMKMREEAVAALNDWAAPPRSPA